MELLTILSMVDSKGDACRIHLICNSASACFNSTDHISACKKIRFRSISCTDNQLHYSVTKIIQSSTMNLNSQFTRRWSILATACRGLQVIWPAAARGGGWNADTLKLVNLGSGSFCVARFLETIAMDDDDITVSHGSDIGGSTNTSYAWWQLQWQQKWWS